MPVTLTLAQRLVEAETAYHQISIGGAIAEVRDQNGETIRYTKADPSKLVIYIGYLKRLIAAESGVSAPSSAPMRPFFT